MKNKLDKKNVKEKIKDKEDIKLDLIKNYLNELKNSSKILYNTNYHDAYLNCKKKNNEKKKYSILNCIKIKNEGREQFKNIDCENLSDEINSNKYFSNEYDSYNSITLKDTSNSYKKIKNNEDIETDKENQIDIDTEDEKNEKKRKKKKNIIFSFKQNNNDKYNQRDSRVNVCKTLLHNKNDKYLINNLKSLTKKKKKQNEYNKTDNLDTYSSSAPNYSNSSACLESSRTNSFYNNKKKNTLAIYKEISNKNNNKLNQKKYKNNKKNKKNTDTYSDETFHITLDEFKKKRKDDLDLNSSYSSIYEKTNKYEDHKNKIKVKDKYMEILPPFFMKKEFQNMDIKNLKQTVTNEMFQNKREKQLFKFLINKALDEIQSNNIKLENKYNKDLIYNEKKKKNENEQNKKELLKEKVTLEVKMDRMIEKDKENKYIINKLENTKSMLTEEIEKLKKKNEQMHDKIYKLELKKNEEEIKVKKLNEQLEQEKKQEDEFIKKIKILNDDLNENYDKYFYYQNKWNDNEQKLKEKDIEIEKLKNEINNLTNENKCMLDKIKYLQNEKDKLEKNNDYLRNDIKNVKIELLQLKKKNEEECQNKEYVVSLYKNEQKKMKEDIENYKIKYAMLENKRNDFIEAKYKIAENKLKEAEQEKEMLERSFLKTERQQKDMELIIKDLKNDLFECKNKLYAMNKERKDNNYIKKTMFKSDENETILKDSYNEKIKEDEYKEKINEDDYKKKINEEDYKENIKEKETESKKKNEINEIIDTNLSTKEKINSLEKQLILLKLEKTNKESELIRCPKHGRKRDEIKKKEILEMNLQYLHDKINVLSKNLKYIKMKK